MREESNVKEEGFSMGVGKMGDQNERFIPVLRRYNGKSILCQRGKDILRRNSFFSRVVESSCMAFSVNEQD